MSRRLLIAALGLWGVSLCLPGSTPGAETAITPTYQLRTYTTAPGKLPVLLQRFEAHNLPIFARHGITLVGAWTPLEGEGEADQLVYLVAFPDRKFAEAAWLGFSGDPDWRRVSAAEKKEHGEVVTGVQTVYLAPTDYSPIPGPTADESAGKEYVYALRTYTTPPGKLDALNARFREHTVDLFTQHGLTSILYTTPTEGQPGADNTLIYFLRVPSRAAADASWESFRTDENWQRIKAQTERGGVLAEKVETLYLKPTAFSPLK